MHRERVLPGKSVVSEDLVAVEEPLEIRVRGQALAVLMRTPGRDRDLVAGFLASEGIIRDAEELLAVERCMDSSSGEPEPNIWNAALAEGVRFDPASRRLTPVGSSCGLCGARTLEELERELPGLQPSPAELPLEALERGFQALQEGQGLFAVSAGSHGAALVTPAGELLDLAEDVGRHNAVDKLLGARLLGGDYPLEPAAPPVLLLVSGRISFELTQKAALAGVALLAGVGMPTSLAVEAAERCGQTLLGWVRDGGASVYAGTTRITT